MMLIEEIERNLNDLIKDINKDTFVFDLLTALKYARERIDNSIKIVIKPWS